MRTIAVLLIIAFAAVMLAVPAFAESSEEADGENKTITVGEDTITVPNITEAADDPVNDVLIIGDLWKSLTRALQDGLAVMVTSAFGNIKSVVDNVNTQAAIMPDKFEQDALGMQTNKVFKLVENVAKNVMVPIAAIIAVLLILYEFVCALVDKNSFNDFDIAVVLRFIMKTALAVWFLAYVFDIVNAVLGLGTFIIGGIANETNNPNFDITSVGVLLKYIICGTSDKTDVVDGLNLYTCISIFFPILLLYLVSFVIFICSYVLLIGRMMEIYLHIAVSPIPFATITNREFGDAGKNFVKTLLAYVLHGAFIVLCCGMFCAFTANIAQSFASIVNTTNLAGTIGGKLLEVSAFGVLMIFAMFKSSGIAKAVVGAH